MSNKEQFDVLISQDMLMLSNDGGTEETMDYTILGRNIAKARNKNHMTQEFLAEKIDVSTVFISQIETAVRKPSLETIYKISIALNTTVDHLIGNNDLRVSYDEIAKLLSDMNDKEMNFITNVLREICVNLKSNQIFRDE